MMTRNRHWRFAVLLALFLSAMALSGCRVIWWDDDGGGYHHYHDDDWHHGHR